MFINLSDTQKKALLMIYQSATPTVASRSISSSSANVVAAVDQLKELNLLDEIEEGLIVSEIGLTAMEDEAIIDEFGEITDLGQSVLSEANIDTRNFSLLE